VLAVITFIAAIAAPKTAGKPLKGPALADAWSSCRPNVFRGLGHVKIVLHVWSSGHSRGRPSVRLMKFLGRNLH
jgi:hypothetical protein